jgi:hypothetical protein
MMMKWKPVFAHLLQLFIDTDRLKRKKVNKRFSVEKKEQDDNDEKNLAENQTSS